MYQTPRSRLYIDKKGKFWILIQLHCATLRATEPEGDDDVALELSF